MHHHSVSSWQPKRQRKLCGNLSTSASPGHHGRNGCFILTRLPPPFVRMRMLMTKNVPITIVDKNGCTRPQRASLRRSLRTRTLKPSSSPSPSPPPFDENENEDARCYASLHRSLRTRTRMLSSSSPSPSPLSTEIAPSAVLES